MLNRRSFFGGLAAALAAPAIITTPVKAQKWIVPPDWFTQTNEFESWKCYYTLGDQLIFVRPRLVPGQSDVYRIDHGGLGSGSGGGLRWGAAAVRDPHQL